MSDVQYYSTMLTVRGFGRIAKVISYVWGTNEFATYMESLLVTNRPNRMGFPQEIFALLTQMTELHATMFPEAKQVSWTTSPTLL